MHPARLPPECLSAPSITVAVVSRWGLWCGVVAGPLLVTVLVGQALWNPDYEAGTDPISSLAHGRHGWVQITTFVVTGLLVAAFGAAVLRSDAGTGQRWTGVLLVVMGAGLVGIGVFVTDPAAWHGTAHNLATAVAINAGLGAALVLAVVWWRAGRRPAATYGVATVVTCAVLGWSTDPTTLAGRHTAVVVLLAAWLTTAALSFQRRLPREPVT